MNKFRVVCHKFYRVPASGLAYAIGDADYCLYNIEDALEDYIESVHASVLKGTKIGVTVYYEEIPSVYTSLHQADCLIESLAEDFEFHEGDRDEYSVTKDSELRMEVSKLLWPALVKIQESIKRHSTESCGMITIEVLEDIKIER